jgi:histidine triad (HIT) family protein
MDPNCIFCKIVAGDLPADKVYADEHITVFRDIHPLAPVHLLIIPNKHLASTNDLSASDSDAAARMLTVLPELAEKEKIAASGYRLIMNTGADGRQEVPHMHLHMLGGQRMKHSMG